MFAVKRSRFVSLHVTTILHFVEEIPTLDATLLNRTLRRSTTLFLTTTHEPD
jgi:hypothetical protein